MWILNMLSYLCVSLGRREWSFTYTSVISFISLGNWWCLFCTGHVASSRACRSGKSNLVVIKLLSVPYLMSYVPTACSYILSLNIKQHKLSMIWYQSVQSIISRVIQCIFKQTYVFVQNISWRKKTWQLRKVMAIAN